MSADSDNLQNFEQQLKRVIGDEPLADATRAQLDEARRHALASVENKSRRWLPLAMAASVAAAGVIAFSLLSPVEAPDLAVASENDLEMLMTEDDLEMLADVEFFQWLSVVEDEES